MIKFPCSTNIQHSEEMINIFQTRKLKSRETIFIPIQACPGGHLQYFSQLIGKLLLRRLLSVHWGKRTLLLIIHNHAYKQKKHKKLLTYSVMPFRLLQIDDLKTSKPTCRSQSNSYGPFKTILSIIGFQFLLSECHMLIPPLIHIHHKSSLATDYCWETHNPLKSSVTRFSSRMSRGLESRKTKIRIKFGLCGCEEYATLLQKTYIESPKPIVEKIMLQWLLNTLRTKNTAGSWCTF